MAYLKFYRFPDGPRKLCHRNHSPKVLTGRAQLLRTTIKQVLSADFSTHLEYLSFGRFAVILLALIATACSDGGGDNSLLTNDQSTAGAVPASWEGTAEPLVQRYCVNCHTEGGEMAPFPLDSYEQVFSKREQIKWVLLNGSPIHPPAAASQLTEEELGILTDWIDSIEPPSTDTSTLNFDRYGDPSEPSALVDNKDGAVPRCAHEQKKPLLWEYL